MRGIGGPAAEGGGEDAGLLRVADRGGRVGQGFQPPGEAEQGLAALACQGGPGQRSRLQQDAEVPLDRVPRPRDPGFPGRAADRPAGLARAQGDARVAPRVPGVQFPPGPVVEAGRQRQPRIAEQAPQPDTAPVVLGGQAAVPGMEPHAVEAQQVLLVRPGQRLRQHVPGPGRPGQQRGELVAGVDGHFQPVPVLPAGHPRELEPQPLGKPFQVQCPVTAGFAYRLPAFDPGADHVAVPPGRQVGQHPGRRVGAICRDKPQPGRGAVTRHARPAILTCTSSSSPPPSGPRLPGPSRRGRSWSGRGHGQPGGTRPTPASRPAKGPRHENA